ncbi:putative ABC transport system ATP-binding protein [Enterococcus sp. PF1-24]|uniref:ABC transporter ATP-binding protein n=1 Tax=unclassified Enterococcus TaxID=2608891 RepID=UPI002472ED55|nr:MULTISPECIES: ATP-binding cassette domain-containing protein [unclassified Enterococcus]MDH6364165.1 putative ABC transport system ATP-binding protein [Enterococcus sp. PFB1-1]MDH6401266.1 putative ABC transport system ATP-binding protein [Enterococcus sp. PF1-24]
MTKVLELIQATKKINNGINETKVIMNEVNLTINQGEFVTVLGGNGAGKSTLFNSIAGSLTLTSGTVKLMGETVTNWNEEKRAKYLARVFQDPKMGTAPRMTVAENLLLAEKRGEKRKIKLRELKEKKTLYHEICSQVGNGLEKHLDTPTGDLSGGQRQALSLLMATLKKPDLLLLDEHTAALDPKTSKQLMALTDSRIKQEQLTCLMITHRMEDALHYGNRLIVLQKGKIVKDLDKQAKEKLTLADLLLFFEEEEE